MDIILVGHANTAQAFKEAVEMVFGKVENFHPLSFSPSEGLEELTKKIETAINPQKAEDTLILTDLFSGTPYNAAAGLVMHHKAADVIAGMSLPLCLEVALSAGQMTVPELVKHVMANTNEYVKCLSEVVQESQKEEDDF
ncbi:PTS system mannose-specific EIIAB component [Agrilactobacillus composti DSM 18527 = JCM 14202]|uniref:PTS system mannose-specific EIIAB component n=1 Tax=Agrilactobacillus composti DSM 18527 = JCM 14202 TaxID=1423734 RepID=X0PGI7_9LACO|nr:PTS sugar transporter subunit IIA [Agrilactobacillus composti]KRM35490.1 PTS system mannose-specific EIIAB component [Agrilactobacillus composti DSM 18527 = JCM 14202]GAF41018.1 PTS system, mannose-specific IIA component [Agrilactobacillus composti DSM 18527 = JCM 14202]